MRTATRREATGWEIQKGGDGYIPKEKTKSRVKQRDVTSFLRINSGRVTGVTNPKRANRRRDPSRSGEQIGHCSCKRATRTVRACQHQSTAPVTQEMHEPFACIPPKFHFPPIHVRISLFQPEESRRTCQWPYHVYL